VHKVTFYEHVVTVRLCKNVSEHQTTQRMSRKMVLGEGYILIYRADLIFEFGTGPV